jgi:hypothetical protein
VRQRGARWLHAQLGAPRRPTPSIDITGNLSPSGRSRLKRGFSFQILLVSSSSNLSPSWAPLETTSPSSLVPAASLDGPFATTCCRIRLVQPSLASSASRTVPSTEQRACSQKMSHDWSFTVASISAGTWQLSRNSSRHRCQTYRMSHMSTTSVSDELAFLSSPRTDSSQPTRMLRRTPSM